MNILQSERCAYVIWCDDIRHEQGDKLSFMGVYQSTLGVPSVPITIPRLAAFVTVTTPIGRPFKKLRVRVMRNDSEEPIAIADGALDPVGHVVQSRDKYGEPHTVSWLSIAFLLPPLTVTPQTHWLKVWVDTEDAEPLESHKLRIEAP